MQLKEQCEYRPADKAKRFSTEFGMFQMAQCEYATAQQDDGIARIIDYANM